MIAADAVSLAGSLYMIIPFAFGTWRWGLAVWITVFLTELVKMATRGAPYTCLKRPTGASACDAWAVGGDVTGAPGFPSGHVAVTAAFWTGAWLLAPAVWRPWVAVAGVAAVAVMGWARTHKRCHTWIQVIAGAMFGVEVSSLMI